MAGHKVIVADKDPTGGFCMTRFSKYVSKFIHINAHTKDQYLDALERIWKFEEIDWFIPVSHINLAVEDVKAKVKQLLWCIKCPYNFSTLGFNGTCCKTQRQGFPGFGNK